MKLAQSLHRINCNFFSAPPVQKARLIASNRGKGRGAAMVLFIPDQVEFLDTDHVATFEFRRPLGVEPKPRQAF